MQQQAVPSRPRNTPPINSTVSSQLTGPPDRKSTVAFSPSDHVDGIFQAVRQQVERWGEHAKWKIELVLLNQPTASSSSDLPHPMNNNNTSSLPDCPTHFKGAAPSLCAAADKANLRSIKAFQREPITGSEKIETWDMPYAADLRQSLKDALRRQRYLEGVVQAQGERLRQLQMHPVTHKTDPPMTALETLHNMTTAELKEQHGVEMKLQQKRIDILARKFKRIAATLERIERMGLDQGDAELDREQLLEERRVLVRKLHLAELRLNARDAELSYLHNTLWSHRHRSAQQQQESDEDVDEQISPTTGSNSQSPYLLQKNYSPQQQPSSTAATRPMSALDSLSILADQMLSDPDFGSEGKGSMPSPDAHENERKRCRQVAPFRRFDDVLNDATPLPAHGTISAHTPSLKGMPATAAPQEDTSLPLTPADRAQIPSKDPMAIQRVTDSRGQTLPPITYPRSPLIPTTTLTNSSNLYSRDPAVSIHNRAQHPCQEVNARKSPSIAALLDSPSQQQPEPFRPSSAFRSLSPHRLKHVALIPPGGTLIPPPPSHDLRGYTAAPSVMSPVPSAYHGPLSPSSASSPQNKRKWSLELHEHHHPQPM